MTVYREINNDQDSPTIISANEVIDVDWAAGILKYKITTTHHDAEQLYQDNPRTKSTYTQYTNWSLTDSLESYQHRAWKERLILYCNNRIPTKEIVLHFLEVFSAKNISAYRAKIFRVLVDNGLEAVTNIELTRGKNGKPNNTVHFHILTNDPRSQSDLRRLFETACERQGLIKDKDFWISYQELDDGCGYLSYFTKYGFSDEVILFRKDTGLQKFCVIGRWFRMNKKQIWKEYIRERYGTDLDKIELIKSSHQN